jgi:hypothetical protein
MRSRQAPIVSPRSGTPDGPLTYDRIVMIWRSYSGASRLDGRAHAGDGGGSPERQGPEVPLANSYDRPMKRAGVTETENRLSAVTHFDADVAAARLTTVTFT